MATVVFVAPYALEATVRFVDAMTQVDGARIAVVGAEPVDAFPEPVRSRLAGHWRIDDCLDADQLTDAVARLRDRLGVVDALSAVLEPVLVPVAVARQRLGIAGMTPDEAANFRDKARMKAVLAEAGVPCSRFLGVSGAEGARAFCAEVGYPIVVKPLAGAGARETFRVGGPEELERWLAHSPPTASAPMQLEEFVVGAEHSFDSVMVDGRMVWYSVNRYLPSPLEVIEQPWIQWSVVLPAAVDGPEYADIAEIAPRAVQALGMRTGLSHLEWFRREDGSVAVSEVGARPPGAQFMTLMSYAHDTDMYARWAELTVHGRFNPPVRRYAVGAAYVRAQGGGSVITSVTGVDALSAPTRSLIVDARLPSAGDRPTGTYEGDGFVVVRSASTPAVEQAVAELIGTIRVERG